jgi:MtfA peptidase
VMYRSGLDPAGQARFDRIAHRFTDDMEWTGIGMEVLPEMKAMISACAAQLLLGLRDPMLDRFHTIRLYKDAYRSHSSGRMHQGDVRPSIGTITISWWHFLHGYKEPVDGENVGLHEMAHALWFDHLYPEDGVGIWPKTLHDDWLQLADVEIALLRKDPKRLLGSYAATNQAEFFAVAVEFFFERPAELQMHHRALYERLVELLGQDPINQEAQAAEDHGGPTSS